MPTINTSPHINHSIRSDATEAMQHPQHESEHGLKSDKGNASSRPSSPRPPAPRIEINPGKKMPYLTPRRTPAPDLEHPENSLQFLNLIGEAGGDSKVVCRHMAYHYLFGNEKLNALAADGKDTPKVGKYYLDNVTQSKAQMESFYKADDILHSAVNDWQTELQDKVGYANNALVAPSHLKDWMNDMIGQMLNAKKPEARILLSTNSHTMALHIKHKPGGRIGIALYEPNISSNHIRFEIRDDEKVSDKQLELISALITQHVSNELPWLQATSPDVSYPAGDLRYAQNENNAALLNNPAFLIGNFLNTSMLSGHLGACEHAKKLGFAGAKAEPFLADVKGYLSVMKQGLHTQAQSPAYYREAMRHLNVYARSLKTLGISSSKIKERLSLPIGPGVTSNVVAQVVTTRQAHSPIIGDYLNLLRTAGLQDPEIADVIQGDGNLALAVQSGNLSAFDTLMDHLDKLDLPAGKLATILEAKQPGQASALNQAAQHGDADMIGRFVTRIGTNPKLSDTEKMHLLQGFGSNDTTCLQSLVSTKDKAGISAYMQALKSCNLPPAMTAALLGNPKHRVPNLLEQICAHGSEHFFWSVVNDFRKALGKIISGAVNTEPTQPEILALYLQEMANLGLNGEAADQILLSPDSKGLTASHYVVQAADQQANQAFGNLLDNLAPAQAVKVLEGRLANGDTTYDTAKTAGSKSEALYHGFMDKQMQRLSTLFPKSDKPTSLTSTLWAANVFNQAKS